MRKLIPGSLFRCRRHGPVIVMQAQLVESCVVAVGFDELAVCSHFYNPPGLHHHDSVCVVHR